ncbi:hypothetical protein J0910_24645 [Nocardiopsis sp. CNT-189]|uniref:hypothetical protein n=1 Tax=Nocardiopsis oceanisediminis TaxID=2816862 RepID=UPI003B31C649
MTPEGAARRRAPGGDRGASFTQYAAVVLCIAAIAGAVLVSVPGKTGDLFSTALCRIQQAVTGDEGPCGDEGDGGDQEADPEYDYTPLYCVKDGTKETYGYSLSLGIFKWGQEYSYAKENLSDGSVVVTFVPTTEVGVAGGAGWDFGKKNADAPAHAGATVEGGVSAKLSPGMTYIFKSKEEYEKFADEVDAAIAEEQNRQMNPRGQTGLAIAEFFGVYERPEITVQPTIRTATLQLEASGDAGIGVWAGPAAEKGDSWNMNLGAQGNVTVSGKFDKSTWYDDPKNIKTSETYGWTGSGSLGATALAAHADGELSWSGGTRIMRNEDGSLDSIRYIAAAEGSYTVGIDKQNERKNKDGLDGGGISAGKKQTKSVTQMVQLDFDTPEEKAAGEKLIEEHGLVPPPYVSNAMADQLGEEDYGGDIAEKPADDAPPWDEVFYEKGRAWQYASDVETDQGELAAKIKMGLQFGGSVNWALEERNTTDALMLAGPEDGGPRRFIEYADCVSDQAKEEGR